MISSLFNIYWLSNYTISLTIDYPIFVSDITLETGLVIEDIINLLFFFLRRNRTTKKLSIKTKEIEQKSYT